VRCAIFRDGATSIGPVLRYVQMSAIRGPSFASFMYGYVDLSCSGGAPVVEKG
jgi:hypothetical protein